MKVGTHKKSVLLLWAVLLASTSFGVYKNFTAIDTHTVHEKEIIQLRLNDTNGIENFVKNFAKAYYSWDTSKEKIEARTTEISKYLTKELQDLNADTIRTDIPTSATVTNVLVWNVEQSGTDDFSVAYEVDQQVKEGEQTQAVTENYTVTVHVAMIIHNMGTAHERKVIVQELIETVGLKPDHIRRYPHEFSGGQRQRIGIARTLALRPEFIVCDEPISALDVSIQAQVINLLEKLQREKGFSYLFIAHDLEMVHHISHKIGVMYLGNMVELGSSDDVYKKPLHPYTRALISAAPIADPKMAKEKKRIILEGEVPM